MSKGIKTMRKLVITLEHLPYRELSPNAREHWAVKNRAVRASKEEIGWLAKIQWHDDKPMMKARISYEFHLKNKVKRDLDNLLASCKAYLDGLIEVGVIFYDDSQHLKIGSVKAIITGEESMIITLEEIAEILK